MKKFYAVIILASLIAFNAQAAEMNHDKKGSKASQEKGSMSTASVKHATAEIGEHTGKDAFAMIKSTGDDSSLNGDIRIMETKNGLLVQVLLSDVVPAGKHGIHIHAEGNCADAGNAAGGHFNPEGVDHGFLPKDGHAKAHVGDMGNIEVDETGLGQLQVFLPGVNISEGDFNVMGKAIIVHAKEDDFGQPTGNAGGRIGCGIIEPVTE